MIAQAFQSFVAYFRYPSLYGIGMAVLFAVFWLALYRPALFKQPVTWLALAGGALAGALASALILGPLNYLVKVDELIKAGRTGALLLAGLPLAMAGGLAQEGAKLLPVWLMGKRARRAGRGLGELEGLLLGAAAGIGFGLLEAQWVHNLLFATGWNWDLMPNEYASGLITFWERLAMMGLHAGLSALAGWGLARGKGWQYFLMAAGLHGLAGYLSYLMAGGVLSVLMMELGVTVLALVLTVVMLSVRGELTKADKS